MPLTLPLPPASSPPGFQHLRQRGQLWLQPLAVLPLCSAGLIHSSLSVVILFIYLVTWTIFAPLHLTLECDSWGQRPALPCLRLAQHLLPGRMLVAVESLTGRPPQPRATVTSRSQDHTCLSLHPSARNAPGLLHSSLRCQLPPHLPKAPDLRLHSLFPSPGLS